MSDQTQSRAVNPFQSQSLGEMTAMEVQKLSLDNILIKKLLDSGKSYRYIISVAIFITFIQMLDLLQVYGVNYAKIK